MPVGKSNYSVKHFIEIFIERIRFIVEATMFCHVLDCIEREKTKKKKKKLRATFISYPPRVNEIFQLTVYPVPLPRFFVVSN